MGGPRSTNTTFRLHYTGEGRWLHCQTSAAAYGIDEGGYRTELVPNTRAGLIKWLTERRVGAKAQPINPDGLYRSALAEAFREGARDLCNCDLGEKIDVPANALVEEAQGLDGVWVHVRMFVSDEDRPEYPGEAEEREALASREAAE